MKSHTKQDVFDFIREQIDYNNDANEMSLEALDAFMPTLVAGEFDISEKEADKLIYEFEQGDV